MEVTRVTSNLTNKLNLSSQLDFSVNPVPEEMVHPISEEMGRRMLTQVGRPWISQ